MVHLESLDMFWAQGTGLWASRAQSTGLRALWEKGTGLWASSEASEQALEQRVQDYESFNAKGSGLWPCHSLGSPLAGTLDPFA